MASIRFAKIAKYFERVRVLENLDLEIKDQELMVFVGPSGCGKSTALRLIAGLETVSSGELFIGDRIVNDLAPKDRDVAMVFQNYALYPHLDVRANIAFGLEIRGTPKPEIEKLVSEAAEVLGLKPLLNRKPKALSGGQRQRVALGRALVRKPSVFLFDEPLSNLDAELRVQMRAEIARLQHRLQTTMVYVTHDQVEAMTLGHRIAVLSPLTDKRTTNLRQVGRPLDLYDRPANMFVAKFIGTPPMNVMRAMVGEDGERLTTSGFVAHAPMRFRNALAAYRGREVLLGIRPEHVSEPGVHNWPHTAPLHATTELLETIGHEGILHGRVGAELIVARLAAHRAMNFGEQIDLALNCEAIHLFDPASEERLAETT